MGQWHCNFDHVGRFSHQVAWTSPIHLGIGAPRHVEAEAAKTGLEDGPNTKKEDRVMGNFTRRMVTRLRREESAQGMVEYALLAALIAVAAIGALTLLGNSITDVFNAVAGELANVTP